MSVQGKLPGYMAQLLEELGWNQGTRIPLANPDNQNLETNLISRQNEIQRLKESLILQNQKRDDLNKYKHFVHTEYQENTRLLFANKQQLEQEVKLKQLSVTNAEALERDTQDLQKQDKNVASRLDRLQNNIARLLKKADRLKTEVCGERGALQEWRAALERNACDISAIEQFTKQDLSKAKELEYKRQKLKIEHDRMHERLTQIVSNLSAEERACERISVQVEEAMVQRQGLMQMWAAAVENLRQRDKDIRHIREDYAVLENECNKLAEACREQQVFCDQIKDNNNEAMSENTRIAQELSRTRMAFQQAAEENATLDSEVRSLQRELANARTALEKIRMETRRIMEEQHRREVMLANVNEKIEALKLKLTDTYDKTKSAEKRAKELEEMLNEEERYASKLTTSQQHAMHCSYVEQQKLFTLKNEEKLFHMQLKASTAIISKLESKKGVMERTLQTQKESCYRIKYQVETIGARIAYMEGLSSEQEFSAEKVEKENRLKDVCARHAARVALMERHSTKLNEDMRRLTRELEMRNAQHVNLQSRLKSSMLNVEGGDKELRATRELWRKSRVEEALMRLKVAHAARAVAGLEDTAFTLDKQRLQVDAAMCERMIEIAARRDMFSVQKRALFEDCGKLRGDIREREGRIEQLKKRYDIFIASLGKDDSGQQLSATFFKIKFAAERAELREKGAALDADIARRERDISALEATLRVVHAAHTHFVHHISPLAEDTPEIEELHNLTKQYYEMRDELKALNAMIATMEQTVADAASRFEAIAAKCKQLSDRETEVESELDTARENAQRQETRLQNARDVVRHFARRAKRLMDDTDQWRIFQLSLWNRDYHEAAYNALQALSDACCCVADVWNMFTALVSRVELQKYCYKHERRLILLINRIVADPPVRERRESTVEYAESVFSTSSSDSTRSGLSMASGYTKRLSVFRRTLATKVQEPALQEKIPEMARRSTVSVRVLTLGLDVLPKTQSSSSVIQRSRARK